MDTGNVYVDLNTVTFPNPSLGATFSNGNLKWLGIRAILPFIRIS